MTIRQPLHFFVNGEEYNVEVPTHRLLIDVLRDNLNLTGTKRSCDIGVCGSCTVLVDGVSVSSCLMLALRAEGRQITTVEGLARDGELHPIQQSFLENWGLQCGFCTPGMLMTSVEMLQVNPSPTAEEVREGLMGNLCRCTGYRKIVESILVAAERMRDEGQELPTG